ncbi:MAG: putative ABC transporter permease [Oscillospiraceae bacterium]|nr:putative ABC transporter permease [Oscillospiraceae bacterium]
MNLFLTLAFLFFVGSMAGWVLELVYRNLAHPGGKWINPGFCTGPYVPLYGFGLCTLFLLAMLEDHNLIADPFWNQVGLFTMMAVAMTVIEYIAGIFCLKVLKVRLWDYSDQWGNLQGIICPLFSFFWAVLGAVYYFLIHPHILEALEWLSNNLAFSFVIGLFFGVFSIDVAHSAQLVAKLRRFAAENDVVVKYESIKAHIRASQKKYSFFRPFRTDRGLNEHLKEMYLSLEKRRRKRK